MRKVFTAAALVAFASAVQAQTPTGKLSSQPELPSNPSTSSAPNPGNDEVSARRRLDDAGYRDLRNVTPNGDGTFSAQGTRTNPSGGRPGNESEVKVDIDSSGNIKER